MVNFDADDRFDFSAIDADGSASGDQAFTLVTNGRFTGGGGELAFYQPAGSGLTILRGDLDGDMRADFQIAIEGTVTLTDDNFVF